MPWAKAHNPSRNKFSRYSSINWDSLHTECDRAFIEWIPCRYAIVHVQINEVDEARARQTVWRKAFKLRDEHALVSKSPHDVCIIKANNHGQWKSFSRCKFRLILITKLAHRQDIPSRLIDRDQSASRKYSSAKRSLFVLSACAPTGCSAGTQKDEFYV